MTDATEVLAKPSAILLYIDVAKFSEIVVNDGVLFGEVADFDPDKIYQAILKAAQTVYVLTDDLRQNLAQVTRKVVLDLQDAQVERPTINMIQSLVENRLMEAGFINIAEHYISYRLQRDLERNGYGDKVIVHLRFEQTK